jgi:hypothetical protein
MNVQRRTHFIWGLVLLGVALVILLRALGMIPAGVDDLINRAWPALLVFGGLAVFLRERLPLGGGLVAAMTTVAFSNRSIEMRDDYREPIALTVADSITLLRVQIVTLSTDVELVRSLEARAISGEFVGSSESRLQVDYNEAPDNTAALVITETQPNEFPMLDAVGRGRFQLELPAGVLLDVDFRGATGTLTLNMSDLSLERLNFNLAQGNSVVTLPSYRPQASQPDASLGTLIVQDGDLRLVIPSDVAARLELQRGGSGLEPLFDALIYNYLVGDILEARNFDAASVQMRYTLTVPRGRIIVEAPGS